MTTTELAVTAPSALTIRPDQATFTQPQRQALLALIGAEDAPDADVEAFFHVCRRTGLDPWAKQIYMVSRQVETTTTHRVGDREIKAKKTVTRYSHQTGIDGFRVLGHRLAAQRGDDLEVSEPLWCGPSGVWTDVWLDPETPPVAAKYTIRKNGKGFTSVVMYSEYVQTMTWDGKTRPVKMWLKMPANQLMKCAEAASWRKAYPQDFSGLVLEDAAHVIDADVIDADQPASEKPAPRNGLAGLRDQLGVGDQQPEQHSDDGQDQGDGEQGEPMIDRTQEKHLSHLLEENGCSKRSEKLGEIARLLGRSFGSVRELTKAEADRLITHLLLPPDARPSTLSTPAAEPPAVEGQQG